ncbi:hypothetical protein ACGF7W_32420 [Streptomyces sp. NPDC048219]|uniref:hypothetical protein n=1 Tax=Streptomyces sp. NPDC048219 TaxID=3365517 RepID=UPI00372324B3
MTPPPLLPAPAAPGTPVQSACHGLGLPFPLVVLDPMPLWANAAEEQMPPERTGDGVLAVRWCGAGLGLDEQAQAALHAAAARAPHPPASADDLAQFHVTLGDDLRMVALPASAIHGPWAHPSLHRSAGSR